MSHTHIASSNSSLPECVAVLLWQNKFQTFPYHLSFKYTVLSYVSFLKQLQTTELTSSLFKKPQRDAIWKEKLFNFLYKKLSLERAHCGRYFNSHLINYAAQLDPKSDAARPFKIFRPTQLTSAQKHKQNSAFSFINYKRGEKKWAWNSLSSTHTHTSLNWAPSWVPRARH
jgi:hypothetical protein